VSVHTSLLEALDAELRVLRRVDRCVKDRGEKQGAGKARDLPWVFTGLK